MELEKKVLVYESLIRLIVIFIGWVVKWTYLPDNFNKKDPEHKKYIFSFTQINTYTNNTILWTFILTFLLFILAYKAKRDAAIKDNLPFESANYFNYSVFIPTCVLNNYYIIMRFIIKPWTLDWTDHSFSLSGHILLKGVSHGIFIRNLVWLYIFRELIQGWLYRVIFSIMSVLFLYGFYENFCTSIFFHTEAECVVGFVLALITVWFPKKNELLNYINSINQLCIAGKKMPASISRWYYKLKHQHTLNKSIKRIQIVGDEESINQKDQQYIETPVRLTKNSLKNLESPDRLEMKKKRKKERKTTIELEI